MLPTIFCSTCKKFLHPAWNECPACGWPRPSGDLLPPPGEPLWRAHLDFEVRGALAHADLVIFWGGSRRGAGGVAALERESGELCWAYAAPQAIEGGLTCAEGRLYFGTIGFLDAGGQLICLDAARGEEIWRREQPAGIWSRPLIGEGRGFVGLGNGRVACFDTRDGQPVPMKDAPCLDGQVWLVEADRKIIALSRHGQIMAYDPRWLRPLWVRPLETGAKITTPPCSAGERLFFGAEGGVLLSLDLRCPAVEVFADGLKGLRGAPVAHEGLLLVGAKDHFLHAFDRESGLEVWRSPEFEHSIVAAPAAEEGLAAAAVNGGQVMLLDIGSGEVIWRHTLPVGLGVMAELLFQEGVLYAGSDSGDVAALPWHLGRYDWAAARREAQGSFLEAGAYFALAGLYARRKEQETLRQRAIENWLQSERPEWAAYLRENDITALPAQIADLYEQTGVLLAGHQPRLAVDCLLEAVKWYTEAEQEEQARKCRRMVSRLVRGPHLRIAPVNVPTIWQEEVTFKTVVELENLGKAPARNVWVRFSGALRARVWVDFERLDPGQRVEVEVPLSAHQPGYLVVEARYQDAKGREFSTSRRFEIQEVVPFEGILIDKDAIVGVISLPELPKKVIIRGDVGVFRVKADPLERLAKASAAFSWPDEPPPGLFGEPQTLIRVERVEKQRFTVPAGYWAVFLADEAAIATVAPGRYDRKKFPPLRGGLGVPSPVWKAVLFTSAPFRLAYRLGPFRTKEGVRLGVECGLTMRFDQSRQFDTWRGILGEKDALTTADLATWLEGEVRGALERWVAKQSEAELSPAFDHRERVMLNLLEILRETTARYGLHLEEPMYYLNFVNPQREQVDDLRAAVYWREEVERAGDGQEVGKAPSALTCPQCGAENAPDALFCTACQARLDGENPGEI